MPQPLPSVGTLITHSWHQYVKIWDRTLSISMWFLFAPLLMLALAFLTRPFPYAADLVTFIPGLLNVILIFWTVIRLTNWMLIHDAGKTLEKNEARQAWSWFFPILWISILVRLAVLGGLFVFVLPGIWLAIQLSFSQFFLLEENIHGTQALAASWALVKGRFWPTFWRLVIPGFLFTLAMLFIMGVISFVLTAIAGAAKVDMLFGVPNSTNTPNPILLSLWYLLQAVALMVFTPLFLTWPVKLFHALKQTR